MHSTACHCPVWPVPDCHSELHCAACRMRQRELEKERDRAADLLRERQRQVHADNEAADSDDEEEPWRRRPYGGSRRALERRRRRELEQQDDAADRKREEAEAEAAAAAAEAEAKAAANQPAAVPEEPDAGKAAAFGADDSIMAAMLAAVKAKPDPVVAATPAAQPASAIAAPVAKRKVRAAFVEEEEEDKPQRKLIPIRQATTTTHIVNNRAGPALLCTVPEWICWHCVPLQRLSASWCHRPPRLPPACLPAGTLRRSSKHCMSSRTRANRAVQRARRWPSPPRLRHQLRSILQHSSGSCWGSSPRTRLACLPSKSTGRCWMQHPQRSRTRSLVSRAVVVLAAVAGILAGHSELVVFLQLSRLNHPLLPTWCPCHCCRLGEQEGGGAAC